MLHYHKKKGTSCLFENVWCLQYSQIENQKITYNAKVFRVIINMYISRRKYFIDKRISYLVLLGQLGSSFSKYQCTFLQTFLGKLARRNYFDFLEAYRDSKSFSMYHHSILIPYTCYHTAIFRNKKFMLDEMNKSSMLQNLPCCWNYENLLI